MTGKSIRHNGYAQVKVRTADPSQRVVLVYNGILKHLNMAADACALPLPERIESVNRHVDIATQLILELRMALDYDAAAEVAETLGNLYDFWERELSDANISQDEGRIRDVIGIVAELRDAWQQAVTAAVGS